MNPKLDQQRQTSHKKKGLKNYASNQKMKIFIKDGRLEESPMPSQLGTAMVEQKSGYNQIDLESKATLLSVKGEDNKGTAYEHTQNYGEQSNSKRGRYLQLEYPDDEIIIENGEITKTVTKKEDTSQSPYVSNPQIETLSPQDQVQMNAQNFVLPAIKDQSHKPRPQRKIKSKLPCTFAHKGEFKQFSPLPIMIQEQKIQEKPKGKQNSLSKKLIMNIKTIQAI